MATARSVGNEPRSDHVFTIAVVLAILGVAETSAALWLGLARGPVRGFASYDGLSLAKDLAFALFPIVGAVIARRQPGNRYWVLLAIAGILHISFPTQYTAFGVRPRGWLPAIPIAAWLTALTPFWGTPTAAP